MAFQINEKLMASDRAIITRNQNEQDLLQDDSVKFKPGMIHYISDNQKLYLSTDPLKYKDGSVRTIKEVITDSRLEEILTNYVHREGGEKNSLTGTLHSIVATGKAPFKIDSQTKVDNLNVDMVDGYHVSESAEASTLVGRDNLGNIQVNTEVGFSTGKIKDGIEEFDFVDSSNVNKGVSVGLLKINNANKSVIESSENSTSSKKGQIEWKDNSWQVGAEGSLSKVVTRSMYGHGNGIDADKVDGKHVDDTKNSDSYLWTAKQIDESKAPRGYGLGTDVNSIPNNDCNQVVATSFYSGISPKNGVDGEVGAALLQSFIGTNTQHQIIEYADTSNKYTRFNHGSSWSSWDKCITKGNVLDEGVNIVLSSTPPVNVKNENTFWFEIM